MLMLVLEVLQVSKAPDISSPWAVTILAPCLCRRLQLQFDINSLQAGSFLKDIAVKDDRQLPQIF
jgi:hypothetical protein